MSKHPLILVFLLTACAGGGDDTATGEPTFTRVNDEILQLSCAFSGCHGGSAGDLILTEGEAYGALVDVNASVEGEIQVIPGDPDNSYVVKKVESAAGIDGDPMPPSAALSSEQVALLRDWITAGALDN